MNDLHARQVASLILTFAFTLSVVGCSTEAVTKVAKTPPAAPSAKVPPPGSPLVWFGPLDPVPRNVAGTTYTGLEDFYQLFTKDASWAAAADHIQVFNFYTQLFDQPAHATDSQLKQIVADLNRRHIAIDLDIGPMTPTASCGSGIEGQGGPALTLSILSRIQRAGGVVRYISMDEPFLFWSIDSSPNACRYSPERVAQEVVAYEKEIKASFPNVVIGDDEGDHAGLADVKRWIDAYHAVSGTQLQFLHWDVDWQANSAWPQEAMALQSYCRDRGIPFGMIYDGNFADKSDESWVRNAEDHMTTFETLLAGHPDHVIFQSWHPYPKHALPETDPTTFTHLVDRYFDVRSSMQLDVNAAAGTWTAAGALTETAGRPIAGAAVSLSIRLLDGPGSRASYAISGVVPTGANAAGVGLRVNMEGAGPGTVDLSLYAVIYQQGGEQPNRVSNGNFGQGLNYWETISGQLESSDQGGGNMLRVIAAPGQAAMVNSSPFAVTAGTTFTVTFDARISPGTVGGGYFGVFFLGPGKEFERQTLRLEPAAARAAATTDVSGTFRYTWAAPASQHFDVKAAWPGDGTRWATFATVQR